MAGVSAIAGFFAPQHEQVESDVEREAEATPPGTSTADRLEQLIAKAAPFPSQDG